jgi:hypothetical protein
MMKMNEFYGPNPITPRITVDSEVILEIISEYVYEECGEAAIDYLSNVKPDHERILSDRLTKEVNEWMKEFGYTANFARNN